MLFILTTHALERLKKRLLCKEIKYQKIIGKAWKSEQSLPKIPREENNIYRFYLGYIWVFNKAERGRIKLITVYGDNLKVEGDTGW